MMLTRRSFLAHGAGALGTAAIFSLTPRGINAATDKFTPLTAKPATVPLAMSEPGARPAELWGYNGQVPGPTLRCKAGERIRVRLVNQLDQPTSLHWHGIRIDNRMDGVPGLTQKAVEPGASFEYDFTAPDPGTYWYHTHSRSWEQMARGLYGLLIVEEVGPAQFDQDLALAIDDWRLTPKGQLHEASFGALHDWAHQGRLGNWLTVNGKSNPKIPVMAGQHVRLRLANTANARILEIDLGAGDFALIALDGRPVTPQPLKDGRLTLAPAQRADLSFIATEKPGTRKPIREVSRNKPFEFAHIVVGEPAEAQSRRTSDARALPPLAYAPKLELAHAVAADLIMTGGAMGRMSGAMHQGRMMSMRELVASRKVWAFNGVAGDLDKPLADVRLGETVVVDMNNDTAWPHAMHLHGHHFRIVKRDGKPVAPGPWRDTVLMQRRERLTVAFVADNPGKWLFHCHMLEHAASGMATWINVRQTV